MIKPMKTAVIGCGMISDTYLQSLKQFSIIEVDSCCDLDPKRAEETAKKFQLRARSYEDILADEGIRLIINLTSPAAHFSISKRAIEAGKHVYSEKMLAVNWEDGIELVKLAGKHQVRLGAAPDTFLGAGIQTARYCIDHGLIGQATSAVVSLNKDFDVIGEILPHLTKKGGDILFDSGCYYLTALVYLLGGVKRVQGFAMTHEPCRVNQRVGTENYGRAYTLEGENVTAGSILFESGAIGSFHFNAASIMNELFRFEIYGTKGVLKVGDPNTFGGKVTLLKPLQEEVQMPLTHGYAGQARGIGAAEMAWSILENREHRANGRQALHVFELAHGIVKSAEEGRAYEMTTRYERTAALPEGYLDNGAWGPVVERALVE